jgi:hypothetical protein
LVEYSEFIATTLPTGESEIGMGSLKSKSVA